MRCHTSSRTREEGSDEGSLSAVKGPEQSFVRSPPAVLARKGTSLTHAGQWLSNLLEFSLASPRFHGLVLA